MDLRVSEIITKTLGEERKITNKILEDDFKFTLNKLDKEGLKERLENIIEEITLQGDKISKHMDISDIRHYRELITEFINEVVTNSHEFSRDNFLDKRGRHRVYGIVKVINKDLDDLAQELLKSEKDNLAILDKTGQIRGLLLDLIA